jgi:DNA-directed RNA polymerase subunit RPC12/RpoP
MLETPIACPHCTWQPDGEAHWLCHACGLEFNMFEDAGRCPRCYHVHTKTACVEYAGGCNQIAPHLDWYKGLDQGLKEINILKTG